MLKIRGKDLMLIYCEGGVICIVDPSTFDFDYFLSIVHCTKIN